MGRTVSNRGYERVHTVACYPDTWKKFNGLKQNLGLNADQFLNLLADSYTQKDENKQKRYLIGLRESINRRLTNKIKKLS